MKTWWKIGDKPRGRWRPKMEFGISFSKSELTEIRNLNIDTLIKVCIIPITEYPKRDINLTCEATPILFPDLIYETGDIKSSDLCLYTSLCENCPFKTISGNKKLRWSTTNDILDSNVKWSFYLPWRSDARPDYSDFIDPVKKFLKSMIDRFESSLKEARESVSSSEWLLGEENTLDLIQRNELPEVKKVRVVRR